MRRPVIGSHYTGPDLSRPCLRQMPTGWYLEPEPKRESVLLPIVGIVVGVLFAALVVRQML